MAIEDNYRPEAAPTGRAVTTIVERTRAREIGEDSSHGTSDLQVRRSWRQLLFPTLTLLLYCLQCFWFVRTQSLTFDEPLHIAAGLEEWRDGRFEQVSDHPPLGHLLPTLPIAHGDWTITFYDPTKVFRVQSITPDPVTLANRTRPVNVMLGVLLGVLLWVTTRRFFSVVAANAATSLFAFSPSLIAHFSLVTTDGICTLMVFATAVQVLRWRSNPSRAQTILLGVVLGLLLLAKLSTPPIFCLTLVLILVLKPDRWDWSPRQWNWRAAVLATCTAMLVVWAGYFFHVSRLTIGDGKVYLSFPNRESVVRDSIGRRFKFMRAPLQKHVELLIPAGEYVEAVAEIFQRNENGHKAFLDGRISKNPSVAFYIVEALLKWPPVVWLLFLCSVVLVLWRKLDLPADLCVMLLYPTCFLVSVILARITMGERHLLPIYPFVLLLASAFWEFANGSAGTVRSSKHSKRALVFIVLAALVVNAADALRYAPDYLSYFNVLIPNRTSYKYLSDSNLDWGQGLLALRRYEAEHPNEQISLAYFGSVDPAVYGIRAAYLPEGQRVSGTVVVSATHLSGLYLSSSSGYQCVMKYPIKAILNHSLFVFAVPSAAENSAPVPNTSEPYKVR
jgi:hypothetical protein